MNSSGHDSSSSVPPDQHPNTVVPDYELLRRLGRGAYGEVWLARNALGTLRAVKVIYRDAFESERPYLREFAGIREFEPVSAHESQVRVYHVGRNDAAGYFYYVMELADDANGSDLAREGCPVPSGVDMEPTQNREPAGSCVPGRAWDASCYKADTLDLRLRQGRLPVAECLPVAIALASAMRHLHEHGLVHRDIKPSNIVFVDGRPKLADIGLIASTTSANTFVGTAGYIPIEGPGKPQADIFSFGKVLYEMATGCDRQDFPRLPGDFASLPDREALMELNEVILRCCQSDPAKRYDSTPELFADLEMVQRGQSLRQRHRWKLQLAAGGIAVMTVAVLALWWGNLLGRGKSQSKIIPVNAAPIPAQARGNVLEKSGCVPAPPDLVAWWTGDGHPNDIVGNHNGQPVNGADYAPGFIGQAFRVNGSNQYFSIPDSPSLSFAKGDQFTIEAWVYRTGGGLPFHVLGKRDVAFGCFYQIAFDSPIDPPPPPLNVWTHLVTTVDGVTEMSYYNGAFVSSSPARCPGPNLGDFHIGNSYFYFGFTGLIDDVRIYTRALTHSEVRSIYAAGSNGMCLPPANRLPTNNVSMSGAEPIPAGLIGWWPADGDVLDYASTNKGTLVNGATFGAGKVGQAFALNGYSDYVQAPNSSLWSFGSNSFTIELWAKFENPNGGQTLVACDEGGGDFNKWILWFNHGGIGLHLNRAKRGGADIGYSSFAPTLNQWYHLAVTRRSTEYVFFINGTAVSTNKDSRVMPSLKAPLTIGAAEGGNFFNGAIDEVRIYSRALAATEIASIYASDGKGTRLMPLRTSSAMRQTNSAK